MSSQPPNTNSGRYKQKNNDLTLPNNTGIHPMYNLHNQSQNNHQPIPTFGISIMLPISDNSDQKDDIDVKHNDPQIVDADFTTCDVYELFNAIQFTKDGNAFIDIRPKDEYETLTIVEATNVPYSIINNNDCDNKLKYLFNTITASQIYCFSNKELISNKKDLKFCKYLKYLNITKNQKIIISSTDFTTFNAQFPYLCYNPTTCNTDNDIIEKRKEYRYPHHILNDQLYLGSLVAATTKYILINLKITHIINMTMKDNSNLFDLNIKYLHCPLWDVDVEPIQNYFQNCINFIDNALKENENRVLVHCRGGVSRSSTIIIAYLMKIHKMKYFDAYKYTKKRRKIIQPNDGFIKQLKQFQQNGFIVKKKQKFISTKYRISQ